MLTTNIFGRTVICRQCGRHGSGLRLSGCVSNTFRKSSRLSASVAVYSWHIGPTDYGEAGAQIDMLIDRADNMVNICEMKFSKNEYVVTKEDADSLHHKAKRFTESIGHRKSVSLTMITVNGISHTGYWGDIHNTVTAEDLFLKSMP